MSKKKDVKRPVLLQVLPELNSGGVERGTIDIAKAANDRGYDSIVASAGGTLEINLVGDNGRHVKLPLNSKSPWTIYRNISRLAKIIKKYNVDIVHARSRGPAWSAYFAAKEAGVKFVTTFHSQYKIQNPVKQKYNSVMTKGDKVIAISNFIYNHVVSRYRAKPEKVVTIARGVDLQYFNPKNVTPDRKRVLIEKLSLPDDKPLIIVPGRITKIKGQEWLIDALSKVQNLDFYCIFVGAASKHKEYLEQLKQKIKTNGLEGKVRFVGAVSDMPALYSLSSVVICPSTQPEGFGRVIVETQAMKKPIIATAHGGALETIIDNKTGWLVQANNCSRMAELITKILSMKEADLLSYGNKARESVEQNYSLDQMVEKTFELYDELLKQK